MATFLPYASCYGNKPALQLMGMNGRSFSSFLGTPPCLHHHRSRQARPTTELTLVQLIRVLRQLPHQSPVGDPQVGGARVSPVTGSSRSCYSKSFKIRCLLCVHDHHKNTG